MLISAPVDVNGQNRKKKELLLNISLTDCYIFLLLEKCILHGLLQVDLCGQIQDKTKEDGLDWLKWRRKEREIFFRGVESKLSHNIVYIQCVLFVTATSPSGGRERFHCLVRNVHVNVNKIVKYKIPVLKFSFISGPQQHFAR